MTGVNKQTGARRESIGTKIDTSLVPYEIVTAVAVGLNYGAEKYEPRNFEKGLSYQQLLMSVERHTRAIMNREEIDVDSGLPHEILLSSSIAMLVACWARGNIVDDRPPEPLGDKSDITHTSLFFKALEEEGKKNREAMKQ